MACYAGPVPIHAWIFEQPRAEVIDDGGDSFFATEPIKKRSFILGLNPFACAPYAFGRLFDALFAGAFARPFQLFRFGHALAGTLVGVPAAGREEILVLALRLAPASRSCQAKRGTDNESHSKFANRG